jgi:hypothetical protein
LSGASQKPVGKHAKAGFSGFHLQQECYGAFEQHTGVITAILMQMNDTIHVISTLGEVHKMSSIPISQIQNPLHVMDSEEALKRLGVLMRLILDIGARGPFPIGHFPADNLVCHVETLPSEVRFA